MRMVVTSDSQIWAEFNYIAAHKLHIEFLVGASSDWRLLHSLSMTDVAAVAELSPCGGCDDVCGRQIVTSNSWCFAAEASRLKYDENRRIMPNFYFF